MVTYRLLFYRDFTQNGTGDVNTPKVIGQLGSTPYKFIFSGGNGIIYAVDQQGRLLFYRDKTLDGTGNVGSPKVIGLGGWQQFKFLFSGGNGIIYAVDQQGRLLFYRDFHQDGTGDVNTPKVIGLGGWDAFKFLFSGGDGIIYAVDQQGKLLFYRDFHQDGTGDVDTPKTIGLGGWDAFKFLFSGGNGIIYAVNLKSNDPRDHRSAGKLLFYRDFHRDGTGDVDTPSVIGLGGWDAFNFLFSGGNGAIYAVDNVIAKPNAPSDLKVTGVADRRVSLSWVDRSDNEDGFTVRFTGKRSGNTDHNGSQNVARNEVVTALSNLRSGYVYTINMVAFNGDGESASSNQVQATMPSRIITVTNQGAGTSTIFTVSGSGFSPGSLVVIRFTDAQLVQKQFQATADTLGKFTARNSLPCGSGTQITVTAFEDADPLGTFANAVITTCP